MLLTVAFAIITAGNTLGGLLAWPASRLVGEITYSVYLLHGLVLFAVFHFLIGPARAASYTAFEHWLVIFACVPLTVLVCCGTFRWIEAPAMHRTGAVSRWLHRQLQGRKWLFGVFAAFFLVLGFAPLAPKVRRQPQPEVLPTGTRFVPHWFMMLALVVFAGAILLIIVGAFRHH